MQGNKSLVHREGKNPDIWINFYDKMKEIRESHKNKNTLSE